MIPHTDTSCPRCGTPLGADQPSCPRCGYARAGGETVAQIIHEVGSAPPRAWGDVPPMAAPPAAASPRAAATTFSGPLVFFGLLAVIAVLAYLLFFR